MKKFLVLVLTLLTLTQCKNDFENHFQDDIHDQHTSHLVKRRCISDKKMNDIYLNSPGYKEGIDKARNFINEQMKNPSTRSAEEIITIPVHVIIVHRTGQSIGQGANIPASRVQDQLDRLNLDFRGTNPDISKTPNIFPTADSRIEFCLAQQDPSGNPTNGITRYAFNGNFDNRESQVKSATGWDHKRYLNIWVAETIDALGYAYLPSPNELPDSELDGVVILTSTFGDGPALEAPYDQGRTGTHEVGHYLGLDHIWGDGCGVDDGIEDTPDQEADNGGCPTHPSPSCGNQGDMWMNYMDYSNDECLYAFTPGQKAYMRRILETSRKALVDHGRAICGSGGGGDEPSCNDGIQNGNETGVDCGGDCQPCQTNQTVDLAITNITAGSDGCNNQVTLQVTVKNNGSSDASNFKINYKIGDQAEKSYTATQNVRSGQSKTFELGTVNVQNGSYPVTATVVILDDSNSSNNSQSDQFSVSGKNLKIVIQPDDYGSEIEWQLWNDETDELIDFGNGYEDFDNTRIRKNFCLEDGCYSFIIYDYYGDGICCEFGNGWYRLKDGNNDVILKGNGRYDYYEMQSFCIDNGVASAARSSRKVSQDKIKSIERNRIVNKEKGMKATR